MAIAVACLGSPPLKAVLALLYLGWLAAIAAVQYTHPWLGTPPESPFEMPMPLVAAFGCVVSSGYLLDRLLDKPSKAKSV